MSYDEWMDYLRFYILFNSISNKSEQWEGDRENLCAMDFSLKWEEVGGGDREVGLKPWAIRSS